MIVINIRLFWNSENFTWTLVEDVADADGCETTVIAEHSEQRFVQVGTPLKWAAALVGCQASEFRPVYDNTHRLPMCWSLPPRVVQAA